MTERGAAATYCRRDGAPGGAGPSRRGPARPGTPTPSEAALGSRNLGAERLPLARVAAGGAWQAPWRIPALYSPHGETEKGQDAPDLSKISVGWSVGCLKSECGLRWRASKNPGLSAG